MKIIIIIINIIVWIIASAVLILGSGSALFGILYFIFGFPLSLILFKFSDNYAVSIFDKFENPAFKVLMKKLIWSNGVASAILWCIIFILVIFNEI